MFRRRGICFWIGIACVVAGVFIILALVLALMTRLDGTRPAVFALPLWLAVLYAGFRLKKAREKRRGAARETPSRPR